MKEENQKLEVDEKKKERLEDRDDLRQAQTHTRRSTETTEERRTEIYNKHGFSILD